jgi:hypothetical protein
MQKRHSVIQPLDKPYRLIALTQGQTTIVDREDFEWLSQWNWRAQWSQDTKSFYAARTVHFDRGNSDRTRAISMAREILKCKNGELAEHKNHDTLDNRRNNLRTATKQQNCLNRRRRSDSSSGFKGVYLLPNPKRTKRCKVNVTHKGRRIHVGYFSDLEEAARAYDAVAIKLHGEFAYLNFPI